MSNVYTLGRDRRLIIYNISGCIYLRIVYKDRNLKTVLLADDYLDSLTEAVFEDKVYYAFQNQDRFVIVRNIMSRESVYVISSALYILHPHIVCIKGELVLFYLLKNPHNNDLSLKCVLPLHNGREVSVPEDLHNVDIYDIIVTQGKTFLITENVYEIEEIGHYKKLICTKQ